MLLVKHAVLDVALNCCFFVFSDFKTIYFDSHDVSKADSDSFLNQVTKEAEPVYLLVIQTMIGDYLRIGVWES